MKYMSERRLDSAGNKYWWDDDYVGFHKEDGPAYEHINGDKSWYFKGKRHREDGPAVIWLNGNKLEWWYNGERIDCKTQEEFERIIKLELFW